MITNKGYTLVELLISLVLIGIIASIVCVSCGCSAQVKIERDNEVVASTVCDTMYAMSDKATHNDMVSLLAQSIVKCSDYKKPTETSYRNQDGSLKHAVVIGSKESKTPGTPYDTCIINWELTPVTALKAFDEVCLNRRF